MKPILATYPIAHAAGTDAGNRSMRKGGRTAWNLDDYNAAGEAFEKILDDSESKPQAEPHHAQHPLT